MNVLQRETLNKKKNDDDPATHSSYHPTHTPPHTRARTRESATYHTVRPSFPPCRLWRQASSPFVPPRKTASGRWVPAVRRPCSSPRMPARPWRPPSLPRYAGAVRGKARPDEPWPSFVKVSPICGGKKILSSSPAERTSVLCLAFFFFFCCCCCCKCCFRFHLFFSLSALCSNPLLTRRFST